MKYLKSVIEMIDDHDINKFNVNKITFRLY